MGLDILGWPFQGEKYFNSNEEDLYFCALLTYGKRLPVPVVVSVRQDLLRQEVPEALLRPELAGRSQAGLLQPPDQGRRPFLEEDIMP